MKNKDLQNLDKLSSKEKILLSAKIEFAQKGLAGARTESIAKRAGVNKAMIHYYFKSKENLYEEILNTIFGQKSKKEECDFFENDNLSIPQKLYVIIYFTINIHIYLIDEHYHKIIAWEIAEGQKYLNKISNNIILPRWKAISSLIQKGIKKNLFETKNPILAVINLVSFIGFYFSQSYNNSFNLDNSVFINEPNNKEERENQNQFIEEVAINFFKMINKEKNKLVDYQISKELKEEIIDKIKNMKNKMV